MLQPAWEPFLKLLWALSTYHLSRHAVKLSIKKKNLMWPNSRIEEALGSENMFFEK